MKNIIFVCLGNICRSPLAEALFRHKVNNLGIESKFLIDSCGTNGFHNGEKADYRTRANAEEHGQETTMFSTFSEVEFLHRARFKTESNEAVELPPQLVAKWKISISIFRKIFLS